MLTINDGQALSRALTLPINEDIKRLLALRRDQLGGDIEAQARFILILADDWENDKKELISSSLLQNPVDGTRFGSPAWSPAWEWIEDHFYAFELVFVFDDSGFAHVIIIEQADGLADELLDLCRTYTSQLSR